MGYASKSLFRLHHMSIEKISPKKLGDLFKVEETV
jgi:hypothetical protein